MFQGGNICSTEGRWMCHWNHLPTPGWHGEHRPKGLKRVSWTSHTCRDVTAKICYDSVEEKARRLVRFSCIKRLTMDHGDSRSSWIMGARFMASWCTKAMQFVSLQNDHHAVDTCRMAWSAGVPIWRTCATQETWRETRLLDKFEMSPVDLEGFKRSGPVKQQDFC